MCDALSLSESQRYFGTAMNSSDPVLYSGDLQVILFAKGGCF